MTNNPEISDLIADVREHVLYMQELGVELLDVNLSTSDIVLPDDHKRQPAAKSAIIPAAEIEIPRDLPELPMVVKVDPVKPAVMRTSKLSGLPSLSKRPSRPAAQENGSIEVPKENETHDINSADLIGLETKELKSAAGLAEALFDAGPELPTTGETVEAIRNDIGDC